MRAMTTPNPDNPSLPLDELNIVPEWIKSTPKSYENHAGEEPDRPARREREHRPPRPRPERPPQREGQRAAGRRAPSASDRRPPAPLTNVEITFLPEEKGLLAMIEIMKRSLRAYALFDVAKLILHKPERHLVKIALKPNREGVREPLYVVLRDEAVFPNRDEALRHIFREQSDSLWRVEKKPCDPPKGNFTCIHRCGITGEIFGPPNYHEYQATLVRFHQRRLRHMPFEEFRARIQSVKDEAAIKQWIESKSFTTEYHCRLCDSSSPLASREEIETHLAEAHLGALLASAPEVQISGAASRRQPWAALGEALRIAWLSEWRFPLKTAQQLSDRLRSEGFHFFKHRKGITYVSRVRPKRVESLDGLSEPIQRIITFLRAHPDSVGKQLAENLQVADPERLLADLHWLIEEGIVVEFADGRLWVLENKPPAEAKVETPSEPAPSPSAEPPAQPSSPPAVPSQESSSPPAS